MMNLLIRLPVFCGVVCFFASAVCAQATGDWERVLSAPVRPAEPAVVQARHFDVQEFHGTRQTQPSVVVTGPTTMHGAATYTPSAHSHQILKAPGRKPKKHQRLSDELHKHSPHYSFHQRLKSEPAKLPQANQRETWKTPYSYGYFGASAKRQWSLHHGYRDRYIEWRAR